MELICLIYLFVVCYRMFWYHGEDNLSDNLVWPWSKKQKKSEWQGILQGARGAEHHTARRLDMAIFSHLCWMKAESSDMSWFRVLAFKFNGIMFKPSSDDCWQSDLGWSMISILNIKTNRQSKTKEKQLVVIPADMAGHWEDDLVVMRRLQRMA